jgi:hypothetical protein
MLREELKAPADAIHWKIRADEYVPSFFFFFLPSFLLSFLPSFLPSFLDILPSFPSRYAKQVKHFDFKLQQLEKATGG